MGTHRETVTAFELPTIIKEVLHTHKKQVVTIHVKHCLWLKSVFVTVMSNAEKTIWICNMFTLHLDQLAGRAHLIRDLFQRLSQNAFVASLVGYYNPVHCLMQLKQPRSDTPPTISMLSRGPA